MCTQTGTGLRLLKPMNRGADRKMAADTVPQRISGLGSDRMLGRLVPREIDGIGFEALVATIQQRDAADRRATFWERAFFALAWITGTVSVGAVLAWMKGGL